MDEAGKVDDDLGEVLVDVVVVAADVDDDDDDDADKGCSARKV